MNYCPIEEYLPDLQRDIYFHMKYMTDLSEIEMLELLRMIMTSVRQKIEEMKEK